MLKLLLLADYGQGENLVKYIVEKTLSPDLSIKYMSEKALEYLYENMHCNNARVIIKNNSGQVLYDMCVSQTATFYLNKKLSV